MSLCFPTPSAPPPSPADGLGDTSLAPSPTNRTLTLAQPELSATLPPSSFSMRVFGGTKPINSQDVFRLSISALATLAAKSFDRSYRANILSLHQDPKIALALGGPGANLFANYTTWGITLATEYMVGHSFRNWRFELYWQQNLVGQIWYVNGHQSLTPSVTDALDTDDQQVTWRTKNTIAQSEVVNPGAAPAIDIMPIPGFLLTMNEVMMTIIGGMSDLAPHNTDERVPNNQFFTRFAPYRARIHIAFSWPPKLSPAWYTYSFLVNFLERLASWYFSEYTSGTSCVPVRISIRQPDAGPLLGQGQLSA
ncbi:MAG: hypothetical protein Q9198_003679 [Flavoplaca austrocitrina]